MAKPSVWSAIPCGTPAQRRELARIVVEHHRTCQERRARVLRHPDIAHRLVTEAGHRTAEDWNGYVPPLVRVVTNEYGPTPIGIRSVSDRRAVYMAILHAVADREARPGIEAGAS